MIDGQGRPVGHRGKGAGLKGAGPQQAKGLIRIQDKSMQVYPGKLQSA
jgi:hypothetical protein